MSLTLIERYIVEAVFKGKRTLEHISKEIGLEEFLIGNICQHLEEKGILIKKREEYELGQFPDKLEIVQELNDITSQLNGLWEANRCQLRLRKFYCTQEQEKMLTALIKNLESYLGELEKNKGPLAKHKLLYMGIANYQDIILEDLK